MDGSNKSYTYTPIMCSTSQLNPMDADDAWLVMPGWLMPTVTKRRDNSNGMSPRVWLSTETVGFPNRIASVRAFYLGVEQTILLIS